ncbi:hypothetical protein MRB53_008090 [Persea americana]|uniref:Uncharacterized protein n=1 Tax=Persea americana TaxID=3435 RepID=A0ACC2MKU1_PERAE|nr:hypothetical protein MRB53_008090 [Persea americana]
MAVSMVVEAALNALIQGIFDKLALPFLKRRLGFLYGGVDEEMKKLSRTFLTIQALLSDAEDRQIKEEAVKLWLEDLKDVAYDAEDIIDEFTTEALRSTTQFPIQTRKRKRVQDVFSYLTCSPTSHYSIECRIKEIRERLDEIASERDQLQLKVRDRGRRLQSGDRSQTSSLVDESIVFGRVDDREKIVNLLRSDQSRAGNGVLVVPIVGMGGLGKTTLAQLVYNDKRIEKHFDLRAWVCASEDFNLIRLTRAIVESLTKSPCHLMNLDPLQAALVKKLKGKKFLLVLDNVWNVSSSDWGELRAPLMVGARGSGILVTTRNQDVTSIMGTVPPHLLQGLSDDDCWSLFQHQAFLQGNSDAHPNLVPIGKGIVKKCKGLPLAVKTLGGMLFSKLDEEQWTAILKSDIWDLPEDRNEILPALRLSYHHLPSHLKQCFAYCSIFPKGYSFKMDMFVLLWMAEGFVQPEGNKPIEDIGSEYFYDLVSRSFLRYEETIWDNQELYTMHDLLHDLAQSISAVECLRMEEGKPCAVVNKVRHVSYNWFSMEAVHFEAFYNLKSLRTLLLLSILKNCIKHVPHELFINLRCMRVLDLSLTQITELPDSIGNLIHLRYLDLSFTQIKMLPKSTTSLYNLQTLKLISCYQLVELPSDLSNLVNLRHLPLFGAGHCGLIPMPLGIGRLKCLQTLDIFNVGKEIGNGITELKDMIHLRGRICISLLENVANVEEVKEAELRSKQKLRKLELRWKCDDVESRPGGAENGVLEGLQPHTNLEVLEITGYCGVAFPRWMGDSSFSNLIRVYLFRCRCHVLPPFGQLPLLKELHIEELYGLKRVGHELSGDGIVKGFPSLDTLILYSMPDWEEWSGTEGDISHVTDVTISYCSKLRELPPLPPTLRLLRILYCERLASLPRVSTIHSLCLWGCDEVILGSLQHLTSLSSLNISEFPNLTSLPNGLLLPVTALEKLCISDCTRLMSLSEEVGLQDITSLRVLEIFRCPQLSSLGDGILPTTLHSLTISGCTSLKCLPKGLQKPVSLVFLEIVDCPEIHSFPEERLPTTVQTLRGKFFWSVETRPLNAVLQQLRGQLPEKGKQFNLHIVKHHTIVTKPRVFSDFLICYSVAFLIFFLIF